MNRTTPSRAAADRFPDLHALNTALGVIFADNPAASAFVGIADRKSSPYSTTSPTEIVMCRFADGNEMRIWCKYSRTRGDEGHGHRGGGTYEAAVYSEVLGPLGMSTPKCYGAYTDPTSGETWLAIEYLDGNTRVSTASDLSDPRLLAEAARWCARFHVLNEGRVASGSLKGLIRYDAPYYLAWADRALAMGCHLRDSFPWLPVVCERFRDLVPDLLSPRPTVIHGEYYPQNVLVQQGTIYPVDWESAAVATGEIDLASLVDGWPAAHAHLCQLEYERARWPEGSPPAFARTLAVARLYWPLRWLGDRPERTHAGNRYFEELRLASEGLGLI